MRRTVLLMLPLAVACAKQNASMVDQSGIYTTYRAAYDDSNRSLIVSANFNFGGSTGTYLQLNDGSQVSFDGQALPQTTDLFNQVIYETEWDALPASQVFGAHSFSYKDTSGKGYTNPVVIPNLLTVQYSTSTIKMSGSFGASWFSPDPIGKQESLYLLFNGTKSDTEYDNNNPTGATTGAVSVASDRLNAIGAGSYTVQLCRESDTTPAQTPAEGGFMKSTSCTAKVSVTISN